MSKKNPASAELECNICNKAFLFRSLLTAHMKVHSRRTVYGKRRAAKKTFMCAQCGKTFSYQKSLKNHWSVHLNQNNKGSEDMSLEESNEGLIEPYKCRICQGTFASVNGLLTHFNTHEESRDFKQNVATTFTKCTPKGRKRPRKLHSLRCRTCGKQFKSENGYFRHCCKYFFSSSPRCERCGLSFRRKHDLIAHQKMHLDGTAFEISRKKLVKCGLCDETFSGLRALSVHVKSMHPLPMKEKNSDSESSEDDENSQLTNTDVVIIKQELDDVIEIQPMVDEDEEEPPFVCDVCDERFFEEDDYESHIEEHDHDVREHFEQLECLVTLNCVECHRTFEKELMPLDPLLTDEAKRSQKCNICEARSKWLVNVGIGPNQEECQTEECQPTRNSDPNADKNPFKCSICDETFPVGKLLGRHVRVHEFQKHYACGVCECAFVGSDMLEMHMIQHTELKLYKCGICAETFRTNGLLFEHIKNHIDMQKLNTCGTCGKAFNDSRHLRNHKRKHPRKFHRPKPSDWEIIDPVEIPMIISKRKALENLQIKLKKKMKAKRAAAVRNRKGQTKNESNVKTERDSEEDEERTSSMTITLECSQCNQEFEQNVEITSGKELQEFEEKCNICKASDEFLADVTVKVEEEHLSEERVKSKKEDQQQGRQEPAVHPKTVTLGCFMCEQQFEQELDETNATELNENKGLKKCNVCKARGNWLDENTAQEIEQHNVEGPFSCSVCDTIFIAEHALKSHMNSQHPTNRTVHECDMCDKVFVIKSSLSRHQKKIHGGVKKVYTFKCHKCDKILKSRTALISHEKSHTGVNRTRSFICDLCGRAFTHREKLQAHRLSHAKEDSDAADNLMIQCKLCGEQCASETLNAHVATCLGTEIGLTASKPDDVRGKEKQGKREDDSDTYFVCYTCGAMFTSEENLKRHSTVRHGKSDITGFTVINTEKKTDDEEADADEREWTQGKRGPKRGFVVCKVCHKVFRFESALKRHMAIHKTNDVPEPERKTLRRLTSPRNTITLVCAGCHTVFEKEEHPGDATQSAKDLQYCNICKARAKWFAKEYISTPTSNETDVEQRKFKCGMCNKVFASKKLVQAHERTHTTPYECTACGKVFVEELLYLIHLRIHAMEQPTATQALKNTEDKLECNKCGLIFASYEFLESHMVTNHIVSESGRNKSALNENNPKEVRCKTCNELLESSDDLEAHMETCVPSGAKMIPNEIGQIQVKIEKEDESDVEMPFMCEVCYEMFDSDVALEMHMVDHEEAFQDGHIQIKVEQEDEAQNESNDEEFMAEEEDELGQGGLAAHGENLGLIHECKLCKQMFQTELELTDHMIKIHSYESEMSSANKHRAVNL